MRGARRRLSGSRSPDLDAQVLLAHVIGRSRSWVLAYGDAQLSSADADTYGRLIRRRMAGEPVAYLRNRVEWYGHELEVTRDVLIPRPETELLLERAADAARGAGAEVICDVGTGSGAIAVGLAKSLPSTHIYATDASEAALAVARRNVMRYGLGARISLLHGHLVQPLTSKPDLIVANLPYLSDAMMATLDRDVRHEPVEALHGGNTGLELYAELAEQLGMRGWRLPVMIEIDPRQADSLPIAFPEFSVEIYPDYSGYLRMAHLCPREAT